MQAVYLLAGENSRFFPLQTMGHKAMSKLYGKPLLEYTLQELKNAGVKNHIFIVGKYSKDIQDHFGDGRKWEVKIEYAEQKEPKGQRDAIITAKNLIKEDFIVLNPYHLFQEDIFVGAINKFHEEGIDAVLCGQYEERIWEYGAFELKGEKIKGIVEKPEKGKETSNIKKTSIEVYKLEFLEFLEKAVETPDKQYGNINAIIDYVAAGKFVSLFEIEKGRYIPTLKYPWDLLEIKDNFVEKESGNSYISEEANVAESVRIGNSDIGEKVEVDEGCEIIGSIIMDGAKIGKDVKIVDSIIGKNSIISDNVIFEAINEGQTIKLMVKENQVDSVRTSLGSVLGQNVEVGANSIIKPGSLIEEKKIFPENSEISGTIKDEN